MSNPLTGHLGNGCYFNLLIRPSLGVQKTMILKVNLCTTGNWRALHPLPTLRYQSKMLQCEKPVISQSYYLPPPYSSNLLMAKNKQKVSCISGTSSRGKRSQPALTPFFFCSFFLFYVLYAKFLTMLLIFSFRGMWRVAYTQLTSVELVEQLRRLPLRSSATEGEF